MKAKVLTEKEWDDIFAKNKDAWSILVQISRKTGWSLHLKEER